MLNITYAPEDVEIARRMQQDLASLGLETDKDILVVLLSPEAVADASILAAIENAKTNHHIILPVMLRQAKLPQSLHNMPVVKLKRDYDFSIIKRQLREALISADTRRRNKQIGWVVLALITISFIVSTIGLATGFVGVPVNEFQTEAAIQNSMIETLTFPTLDPLMPRTTQDAQNFPMTVEAANTRNAPLLQQTATALPRNIQASQEAFLTIEAATSTARAEED